MNTKSARSGRGPLWLAAWHHLHGMDRRPPVSTVAINQLMQVLPERAGDESVSGWLKRRIERSAQVIAFPGKVRRFQPVAEFYRMAADSGSERYPLPETTLESADGRLWLSVDKQGDQLELTVQAVGMAVDELAGRWVGLASDSAPETLVAAVMLDEQGEGRCVVADTDAVRQALLHPVVGIVEFSES
ncbi:MAG: hypothetical protein FIA97_17745 [Methylococcaceae bacterium]|nr:hypothetical protein [Methylococcaceae bacterium]